MKRLKELEAENARLKKIVAEQAVDIRHPEGGESGKLLSPSRRRAAVEHVRRQPWGLRASGVQGDRSAQVEPALRRAAARRSGTALWSNGWSGSPGRTPATATGGCGRC